MIYVFYFKKIPFVESFFLKLLFIGIFKNNRSGTAFYRHSIKRSSEKYCKIQSKPTFTEASLIKLQSYSLQINQKEVLDKVISCEFCEEKTEQLFNITPLSLLTVFKGTSLYACFSSRLWVYCDTYC